MNFLPVISRELQVQARQPATHRSRWITSGIVMLLWLGFMLIGGRATAPAQAQVVFVAIGLACLGFALLAGVFQTADCLSQERREGTLGLLFLTDLRGYDVVLGKLASTSLNSSFTFLAVMPVLALTFTMGGMTWGEFWRVMLVLLTTLFLSLAVGMMISALSRDARLAMGGTILIILGLFCAAPGAQLLLATGKSRMGDDWWFWCCPPFAFREAFDDFYSKTAGPALFGTCILTMLIVGCVCLAVASWLVPRRWQDTPKRKDQAAAKPRRWRRSAVAKSRKLREKHPLLWLTTRDSRPQRLALGAFAVLFPVWLYFLLQFGAASLARQQLAAAVVVAITYGLHLIVKCLIAAEASRLLNEDRRSGALELLLVAPLTVPQIVASQVRGIWNTFWRWGALLTAMNLLVILFTVQANVFGRVAEMEAWIVLAMAGGIVMLFLDSCAMVNVGLWMALRKGRQAQALLATVRRVLLPPWLFGGVFFVVGLGGSSANGVAGALIIWFIISFIANVLVTIPAIRNLRLHFREVVSLGNLEARLQAHAPQPTPSDV